MGSCVASKQAAPGGSLADNPTQRNDSNCDATRAHSASDHKAELYLTCGFPSIGCGEETRTPILFYSQPARKQPKWKKQRKKKKKTFHKWFSVLPTISPSVLVWGQGPSDISNLQNAVQMFTQNQDQTLSAEHETSKLHLRIAMTFCLPSSYTRPHSALCLTTPAHGRCQVSSQVEWNSTISPKAKLANWSPRLALLSGASLFSLHKSSPLFILKKPTVMSSITDHR